MKNQCQHLTIKQHNELIKLLQIFEDLFNVTLDTWKTDLVDFELKGYAKQKLSQPYPVPKVHE